eukprot:Nitzschia sp. Nitz4//scaffold42_size132992//103797//106004//NITZ4_003416-RA/size132992-processed-gene-0.19-mRNA-1//1//CDS//3329551769//1013//frame0
MPMNFDEIDAAKAAAANMSPSAKRGKKRKNATIARLNPSASATTSDESGDGSDLRTGRWTTEETLYCDKLIECFQQGELPVSEGVKLNDFLANMLKSKQSRLTKKMKNARLSAKSYKAIDGYVSNAEQARSFSELERSFYDSIQCDMERAEIRFHMQKEWRELFSAFCVAMGQKLNADAWLSSVEEMDRRVSQAKDAARMARRKVMMGYALSQDSMNQESGVFIENPTSAEGSHDVVSTNAACNLMAFGQTQKKQRTENGLPLRAFSSPFVGKVIQYMQRHQVPFEHIDAWVPSFVSSPDQAAPTDSPEQKCRLCFAGFATTEHQVPQNGGRPEPLPDQDRFDLMSFGEYSSKFSFDVGCGLPGRVYNSGVCSWEQGVANAPSHQFERCGGASQWGIKTVLGVPIPSPNVGRIVVLLYSRNDRPRDPEMVRRITEELTKLMPTPKWKLVVDVGSVAPKTDPSGKPTDSRVAEVLKLMVENVPTHRNSPYSSYLPGFTALRLLLVKAKKTAEEEEMVAITLESYSSYLSSGRQLSEIAWMVARDFMILSQGSNTQQQAPQHSLQQMQAAETLQNQQLGHQLLGQHNQSQNSMGQHSQSMNSFHGSLSNNQLNQHQLLSGQNQSNNGMSRTNSSLQAAFQLNDLSSQQGDKRGQPSGHHLSMNGAGHNAGAGSSGMSPFTGSAGFGLHQSLFQSMHQGQNTQTSNQQGNSNLLS